MGYCRIQHKRGGEFLIYKRTCSCTRSCDGACAGGEGRGKYDVLGVDELNWLPDCVCEKERDCDRLREGVRLREDGVDLVWERDGDEGWVCDRVCVIDELEVLD